MVTSARAAQAPGRPLQPQRCCASLRDRLRRPVTLEPLPALRQDHNGQVTALPATTRRPSSQPSGYPTTPTFPSPNVNHHPGQKRQASGGTGQEANRRDRDSSAGRGQWGGAALTPQILCHAVPAHHVTWEMRSDAGVTPLDECHSPLCCSPRPWSRPWSRFWSRTGCNRWGGLRQPAPAGRRMSRRNRANAGPAATLGHGRDCSIAS